MKYRSVSIPQLGLIGSTRGMLGAGIGLLLADRLSDEQRRAVGWTLVGVGMVTTIPLVAWVFGTERRGRELTERPGETGGGGGVVMTRDDERRSPATVAAGL